jgi:hypothetical protein
MDRETKACERRASGRTTRVRDERATRVTKGTRRDATRRDATDRPRTTGGRDRTNDRARIEAARASVSSSSIRGGDETSDEGEDVV